MEKATKRKEPESQRISWFLYSFELPLLCVWVIRGIQLLEESRLPLVHCIPVASITVFVFSTRPWLRRGGTSGMQGMR